MPTSKPKPQTPGKGAIKQSERGSPTTQPAAVVGNPSAGRSPGLQKTLDDQQAKSDAGQKAHDKGVTK